ncbi:hypothetical protein [Nonomuraea sp. KM90]|uniref:hypothetical protein n=1 Tax=Nonomuraea sp. KM90 TaxID=3457428 RepID=UPI003FCD7A64
MMSAVVIFTEDEPWFINSYNWHSILERSTATSMRPADREKFNEHINVMGVNFPLIEQAADRRAVAEFLLGLVEDIQRDLLRVGKRYGSPQKIPGPGAEGVQRDRKISTE